MEPIEDDEVTPIDPAEIQESKGAVTTEPSLSADRSEGVELEEEEFDEPEVVFENDDSAKEPDFGPNGGI